MGYAAIATLVQNLKTAEDILARSRHDPSRDGCSIAQRYLALQGGKQ